MGFGLCIADEKGKSEFEEYYPLRHKSGPNLDAERVYDWLLDELAFYSGIITGANLLYDFDGFQYQGIKAPFAKFRDVQWAEPLIDENGYNYSLDTLSRKYLGHGKVTDELKMLYGPGYKERMHEIHPGHMRGYVLGDITQPPLVLHEQMKELRKQNLDGLFDIESRLFPMLVYMRGLGQRVNMPVADTLRDTLFAKRAEALQNATKALGKRGLELTVENFGKPAVLQAAFDHLGIRPPRTAPTASYPNGQISVTDSWLDNMEHPFGDALMHANKYDKALETFVNGYISDYQVNGRVHPEFHPLRKVDDDSGKKNGTISGRFSCGNPNLQNIPARDEEIGPLCRAMFIPDEGMDYWSGDYSQIEYRMIVHKAVEYAKSIERGDANKRWGAYEDKGIKIWERLQSVFKAQQMYIDDHKTDFHAMCATLTGLPRKTAKNINFGIAFTMGIDKLANAIGKVDEHGKPTKEAHEILDKYHDNVPFVKAISQALTAEARENGWCSTILGRRSHFDMWEPRKQDFSNKAKALPHGQAQLLVHADECPPGVDVKLWEAYKGQKLTRAMTHKALNCYTQGSGADLMKLSLVLIWESGLLNDQNDLTVSLTVHDELDGSVGRSPQAREKLKELQHIMETSIPLNVPCLSEFKVGENWACTH